MKGPVQKPRIVWFYGEAAAAAGERRNQRVELDFSDWALNIYVQNPKPIFRTLYNMHLY